jgi:membrane associated rhomboid family serine protease
VKHKDHSWYRSLGASGAVSAVLFSFILLDPWAVLRFNFIIPIPAILFAIGYLWYSTYMSKQQNDHIAHGAHLFGALYGMLFPMVFHPSIIPYFIEQIQHLRFFN